MSANSKKTGERSLAGVCCDVAQVPLWHLTWSETMYLEWWMIHSLK